MEDQAQIDAAYKYWRMRIFYSTYVGYVFFYFSRKCFTFSMPALIEQLHFSKTDLGLLGSILYLTYGFSKFFSGILSDRSNPRYFMSIGLMLTGVANICFGFSGTLFWFAVFWGLNGIFQGWGWAPCAKQLTHWYHQKERGRWWSIWSSSHNVGGFLIALFVPWVLSKMGHWSWGMHAPGLLCILAGFFLMERLRDVPRTLGLPTIEEFKAKDFGEEYIENSEKELTKNKDPQYLTAKKILFEHVLTNKYIWLLSISYFFVYVVRMAVNDWGALYLYEEKNYSTVLQASLAVGWFEIGGFLGTIAAGWGSDYFFKGRRVPVMILCAAALVFAIYAFWSLPEGYILLDSLLMGVIGFLIFGPQMLTGLAAAEFVHKKAAGTSTGFAGCFAYFGAAASAYPMSKVTQEYGWDGFFVALVACCVVTCALLLPMWSAKSKEDQKLNQLKEAKAAS